MVDVPVRFDSEFEGYSEEFLQNLVDENTKAVEELEFENFVLDRYMKRLNIKSDIQDEKTSYIGARSSRNRSRIRNIGADRALRLNPEQKCTIAKVEIESFNQELTAYRENAESILDDYRAHYDEAELQIKQLEKYKYNYIKSTTKRPYQSQPFIVTAERIIQFIEEIVRAQDTLVDKFRLNNSTLRYERRKLLSQQKQKEEMGEVLHEVDFEQLKIENAQFLEIIDNKNQELLRLKLTAGRITQTLNGLKRKLTQLNEEAGALQVEIKNRQEMVARTTLEAAQVAREKQKIEAEINRLKQLIAVA